MQRYLDLFTGNNDAVEYVSALSIFPCGGGETLLKVVKTKKQCTYFQCTLFLFQGTCIELFN